MTGFEEPSFHMHIAMQQQDIASYFYHHTMAVHIVFQAGISALKVSQAAFAVACFQGLSDIQGCSGVFEWLHLLWTLKQTVGYSYITT